MNKIDTLLKSAREKVPSLSNNFSEDLIKEINMRNLQINSAKKSRNMIIYLISIILSLIGLILINAFIYEIKMNGSLELLNFGTEYLFDFIAELPFDLLILIVLFISTAIFLFHQTNGFKRIAITYLTLGITLFTGIGGTALAHSGINENIQDMEFQGEINIPIMHDFYVNRATFRLMHDNVIIGKILEVGENSAIIETPLGDTISVSINDEMNLKKGEFVRIKGNLDDENNFDIEMLQHCSFENFENYYRHHEQMQEHHDNMMKNMMM